VRRLAAITSFLLVMSVTFPARADVTRAELDAARTEINAINRDLEDELAALEEIIGQKFLRSKSHG